MATTSASGPAFDRKFSGTAPENYERYFVPVIGAPFAADLVAQADLRRGQRVLDIACGTGIVARMAAERVAPGGTVAALDSNAGMLAAARSIALPAGTSIRWYEANAESIPLPDDAFDVVFCQMGLQFVADKGAALREMRRVLVPDGRLLLNVPAPTPLFDVLDRTMTRYLPAAAVFVRMVFALHDIDEIERLFRGAGFRNVAVRRDEKVLRLPTPREFLWQYISSTPLAGAVAEAHGNLLADLERDVVDQWQPWVRDGGMTHHQGVVVATARK